MNLQEITRLIRALREEGWCGDDIDDLLLYLEGKDDQKYLPRKDKQR
ncbi:MAG: hypothetical protein J6O04_00715 [Selenomonadaceae bacterium]|nr:hypothetical protein [Selenomonadaceae bacterium]